MIRHRLSRGFSLIELALVLAVLGFLMMMVFSLKNSVSTIQTVVPSVNPIQRGADALVGFVVMTDRLPCPDTAGVGVENCTAKYGGFPWKTVGLSQPLQNARGFGLVYGVYRNAAAADLAVKSSAYIPTFLDLSVSPNPYTSNINGLDFCENLRRAAKAGYLSTEVSAKAQHDAASLINLAFLLADPGETNADRAGGLFDGVNNSGVAWESPGLPKTLNYDDQVMTMGFYQLAARLDCPAIIARVSGAVRDANAAYDIKRTYDFLKTYRDYNVNVRTASKDLAYIQDIIATFDLALSAAMSVTDIAITLSSGSGAVAGAISIVNGVIAIGMSAVGKFGGPGGAPPGSAANYASAQADLITAQTQAANAVTAVATANAALATSVAEAKSRDAKGWFQ